MEVRCAGCGCLVDAGEVVERCGDPECCCKDLPDKPSGSLACGASSIGTSSAGLSSRDGVEAPGPRDAFEFVLSPVLELDAGASDEVGDGARHEHLTGTRQG